MCGFCQFSVLLLVVFILELSGGIAGYVLRDSARDFLKGKLNESMHKYDSSIETQEVWFGLQTTVSWLQFLLTFDLRMKCWMNKYEIGGKQE